MNEIIFSNKGFSIERLRLLCDVVRMGGIRAAVGDDPVRQSLASRQLKELSTYAKVELIQHVGRGIEPTKAGAELAKIGNDFFSKLSTFLQHVQNLPTNFKLGVGDSIFQWQILPRMKEFNAKFKNITLVSYSYPTTEIIKSVESNRLDAGIVRKTALTDSDIIAKHIGAIRYKLFIPNVLCKSTRSNQMPMLSGIPFCTLTGDGEYAKGMARFLSAFKASPSLNCSSMTQMYAALQSGQYAAILPANAEQSITSTNTAVYTLPELTAFTRQIYLVFKRGLKMSPEKNAILEFLNTCIDSDSLTPSP